MTVLVLALNPGPRSGPEDFAPVRDRALPYSPVTPDGGAPCP
jgi:hypothetical protein